MRLTTADVSMMGHQSKFVWKEVLALEHLAVLHHDPFAIRGPVNQVVLGSSAREYDLLLFCVVDFVSCRRLRRRRREVSLSVMRWMRWRCTRQPWFCSSGVRGLRVRTSFKNPEKETKGSAGRVGTRARACRYNTRGNRASICMRNS
jgi:hypothetical protein